MKIELNKEYKIVDGRTIKFTVTLESYQKLGAVFDGRTWYYSMDGKCTNYPEYNVVESVESMLVEKTIIELTPGNYDGLIIEEDNDTFIISIDLTDEIVDIESLDKLIKRLNELRSYLEQFEKTNS